MGALAGCRREIRSFRPEPPDAEAMQWTRQCELEPGSDQPADPHGPRVTLTGKVANQYEENAYALSEGKRLFSAFNCVGCHAHGGGAIGPPLMDEKWIYGSGPEQVFATIVEGRPNGMPSFGARIPAYQIWQLAAYVRSLAGLVNPNAAPSRDDHMSGKKPEASQDPQPPAGSPVPKSAERPQ